MNWWTNTTVRFPCEYKRLLKDDSLYYDNNYRPKKGTRIYDADCMFNRLVDYCYEENFRNDNGTLVVSPNMKNNFLKFLKDLSKD